VSLQPWQSHPGCRLGFATCEEGSRSSGWFRTATVASAVCWLDG